jgi:putative transposase
MPSVREQYHLSTRETCRILGVARAAQYRKPRIERVERKVELLIEVERILTEFQGYGYRRVTKELHRRNQHVNHKKVLSLMRQEQLLCKRGKRKNPKTTNSNHSNQIYPNLIKKLKPSKPDQVWHSDLTYIRLNHSFVYLAAVLDGFSRKIVGSAIGLFLDTSLPLEALHKALNSRNPKPGLIHHSDRGVQYTSHAYIASLEQVDAQISMSRRGNPYDNAKMESFMATLKLEEVHLDEYEDFGEVQTRVMRFIECVYNVKRLHSSLGYVPPVEFETAYFERLKLEVQV